MMLEYITRAVVTLPAQPHSVSTLGFNECKTSHVLSATFEADLDATADLSYEEIFILSTLQLYTVYRPIYSMLD